MVESCRYATFERRELGEVRKELCGFKTLDFAELNWLAVEV